MAGDFLPFQYIPPTPWDIYVQGNQSTIIPLPSEPPQGAFGTVGDLAADAAAAARAAMDPLGVLQDTADSVADAFKPDPFGLGAAVSSGLAAGVKWAVILGAAYFLFSVERSRK